MVLHSELNFTPGLFVFLNVFSCIKVYLILWIRYFPMSDFFNYQIIRLITIWNDIACISKTYQYMHTPTGSRIYKQYYSLFFFLSRNMKFNTNVATILNMYMYLHIYTYLLILQFFLRLHITSLTICNSTVDVEVVFWCFNKQYV